MAANDLTYSEITAPSTTARLFTPNMVLVATLLGGILGGCSLIWANYRALKKTTAANKTVLWTIAGFIGFLIIGSLLPSNGGSTGISIGLAFGLKIFSAQTFGKEHPKASWWIAILVGIVTMVTTILLAIIIGVIYSLFFPQGV